MLGSSRITLAAALALASIGMASVPMPAAKSSAPQAMQPRRAEQRRRTASHDTAGYGHATGPGWTHRQVKRMATKRRNQLRHRAACKRKRN